MFLRTKKIEDQVKEAFKAADTMLEMEALRKLFEFEIAKLQELRPTNSYGTLEEIIRALEKNLIGASSTYVAKKYTKQDLINDLERIEREKPCE